MLDDAWRHVQEILHEPGADAHGKIARIGRFFFLAEADLLEKMGAVLAERDAFFERTSEHAAFMDEVARRFRAFLTETLPSTSAEALRDRTDLLMTSSRASGRATSHAGSTADCFNDPPTPSPRWSATRSGSRAPPRRRVL